MTQAWGRTLFWIGAVVLAAYVLNLLSSILLPFVMGSAIAFLLDPFVIRLDRLRVPRSLGSILVLFAFLALIVAFILLLVPLLENQITALVSHFPAYLAMVRDEIDHFLALLQDRLDPDQVAKLRDAASAKVGDILAGIGKVITSLLTGGIAIANLLSLVFITPIVAFFLLRDWEVLLATIDSWLPREHAETIREQARLIEQTLSGFLRGQASVCLLLGMFYGLALTIIGLDFGLVLGLVCGCLIFIPFLGGFTGGLLSVGLAFAQFGSWHKPLVVAALFVVGQTLEGNIITPKLVGDRVNLHPVWLIFSLLAFGALFGFVGVLIAVPMAAVIGVLVRFALKRYLLSPLYDPANAVPANESDACPPDSYHRDASHQDVGHRDVGAPPAGGTP
ncbi:AI-2E family transporter [Aliidongia dinghuensis]|uniref:AI-2E family transporter n=1 Tax=Aliidongia dinghuensis TaxID=1867774 RepID=A0A8J2YVV9_9PROT|nr:AI-2E family transporter [Aliidongia dinghuensis]GGF25340.1 AI-2E family transporter [Aliidongia dinghuensis]